MTTPAPVPPASGLSDERLAERLVRTANALIPLYGERSEVRWVLEQITEQFVADAALGAALREVLAEATALQKSDPEWSFRISEHDACHADQYGKPVDTDASRKLSALLSLLPEERTRT